MIHSPENYVLVEIEKKFQDKDGGIFIDPSWRPEEYATLEGVVVSAPERFSSDDREILGTVAKGDRVFFSYSVVFEYSRQPEDDTFVYKNLVLYEGKEYWQVHAGEIFCKVTDKIEMITDHVLIEPYENTIDYGFDIRNVNKKETGIVKGLPAKKWGVQVGDKIAFESQYVQEYNIFGKIHYIIPGRRAIAKIWT